MLPFRTNLVKVPDNLEEVTTINEAEECAPKEVGLTRKAVDSIWASTEDFYRTGLHPSVSLVIRRHGQIVLKRAIGHVSGNGPGERHVPKVLATPDHPICLFSSSKAISAMLLHKIVEQGKVRLDDRVAETIPEYAANGKGDTTIRQLMSHRAGIPSVPAEHADPSLLGQWDKVVQLLCAQKPVTDNREHQGYHAITAGFIIGEIVRRQTGRELPDLMREWFAEPLGAKYLCYGVPESERAHASLNYFTGPHPWFPLNVIAKRVLGADFEKVVEVSNSTTFMDNVVPAGNIWATADEASRFYQMMLNGGVYEGKRIFNPDTIEEAVRPVGRLRFDRMLMLPMRFSPGFMLGETPFGLYGARCRKAYGHLGFLNIVTWADPERDISVALLNSGKTVALESIAALGKLLAVISHGCPPQAR